MPPVTLHTAIAKEVADRLRLPALEHERGSLYLGSTAPDIRVITRWERERTHFFNVRCFEEQSSVCGFLQAYPALSRPAGLSVPTAAFVAGYITHLVMDETWINTVYRPYFGEKSPLGGTVRANIMDRALQFSLDSDSRNDRDLMRHVMEAVVRSGFEFDVEFIDAETLRRWHEVIINVVSSEPDWERFRRGARRHLQEFGLDVDEEMEEFTRSLPDLVDETLRYLTPERVQAFIEESLQRCLEAAKEYLECA